jgi:hypothetical protein
MSRGNENKGTKNKGTRNKEIRIWSLELRIDYCEL